MNQSCSPRKPEATSKKRQSLPTSTVSPNQRVEQLCPRRAQPGTRRADRALLADLAPMLDERELLSLPYAKKQQQLSEGLADRDPDGNGNGSSHGRHL